MITVIALGPMEANSNGYSIRTLHLMDSLMLHDKVTLVEFNISPPAGAGETSYRRIEYDAVYRDKKKGSAIARLITFNPFGQLKLQLVSLNGLWRSRKLIRDSEVVFVEGALFPFAIVLAKLLGKKVVMDTHCVNYKLGLDFKKYNRAAYALRCVTWGPLEYFAYKLSDRVVFVSENEVTFSEDAFRLARDKSLVIPNVLDIKPLTAGPEAVEQFKERYGLKGKLVTTFIGDLTSVQNNDCVSYILNDLAREVGKQREDIVFLIVGKGAEMFSDRPANVVFTGYLDDIDPVIASTDLFVAPMRVGAGTKTKVLLFMAYGIPILATEVGVEGIDVAGRDQVMVRQLEQFPAAVVAFKGRTHGTTVDANGAEATKAYSPEIMRSKVRDLLSGLNDRS